MKWKRATCTKCLCIYEKHSCLLEIFKVVFIIRWEMEWHGNSWLDTKFSGAFWGMDELCSVTHIYVFFVCFFKLYMFPHVIKNGNIHDWCQHVASAQTSAWALELHKEDACWNELAATLLVWTSVCSQKASRTNAYVFLHGRTNSKCNNDSVEEWFVFLCHTITCMVTLLKS